MGYFYVLLTRLALSVPFAPLRRAVYLLILTACVSLSCSVLIPYLPREIPDWAALHTFLAAASCVLLAVTLLLLLLYRRERGLLWGWLIMVAGCGVLFLRGGMVTSALEVFFTLSAALLTRALWIRQYPRRQTLHIRRSRP